MFELLPEMPLAAKFFVAFLIVLGLIALTAWLVRRIGANRLGGSSARGRQPRLAVIDAASVDGRRRLVLIRRDNIEHLLMIGGPTDVVVEQNIVRVSGARDSRDQTRLPAPGDGLPRAVPLGDNNGWPLQPGAEIAPGPAMPPAPQQPPARISRGAPPEETWLPSEPAPTRQRTAPPAPPQPDSSARFATPELNIPPPPPLPEIKRESAVEPTREAAPVQEQTTPPQTDRNLAEMAQRLEAALRAPRAGESKAPAQDPFSVPLPPPRAPDQPRPAAREAAPQPESKPASPSKSPFDSLEQEMANLLGRPSSKT
ncbi:MAG: flagellar biosynthetic protein FliO [Pseudolabrys sp.]